ncbi:ATP-binding protein [Dysosmobacter sp.]|uniref:ATP-binding protein n=1 Tax=Dysosmobacter sp. TaxID=2591382 RepID=UPI002A8954A5|nr:AAA family ATPase [Dysosmobacter sp.]MDY3282095.1 AAA family ATPase [Dysosmobacter sp.]
MNIKQAKEEIQNTLRAYLARDELGNYRIPAIRQRPILLMGPPGVGKTQIMEQIAAETGVGLVAYTITHHTRQSAVGLPFIEHRTYGGREFTVTEYTMSEILASVYSLMERTGLKEGILFLDEINCVSETLAPMMLQVLQCKTFGNQALPEGWTIVAAGNPPEYNKSVRDFDVVTLDRVKRMDVEADFAVWKEYARRRNLHGAVVSYLDIKKENFYHIETTVDGLQFVTARGWEDLSELICAYEQLGIPVDRQVVGQYIQTPAIARDFANYLALYYKYQRTYHVEDILRGRWSAATVLELRAAPFDQRLSVMGLLLSRLSEAAALAHRQDSLCAALHGDLTAVKQRPGEDAAAVLEELRETRQEALQRDKEANRLTKDARDLGQRELAALEDYRGALAGEAVTCAAAMELLRQRFARETDRGEALARDCGEQMDAAFRFLEETFGAGQELVLFVTEITAGYDTSWFVETFGCDAYFRHNRELLFDDSRRRIAEDIAAARHETKN